MQRIFHTPGVRDIYNGVQPEASSSDRNPQSI